MWVRSLGRKDALEEEMATQSSILAWEIPWTEEPGGLQSMGYREWATTEHMSGCHSGKRIHLPMQEMLEIQVQCLSWEDSLEEEMATQSSILAWEIP